MHEYKTSIRRLRTPLALAVGAALATTVQAETTDDDGTITLPALTVTANKRAQDPQDAATALSVIDAATVDDAEVNDVEDLTRLTPSTFIANRANRRYSQFTIRGISSPDFYNSSVAVYVDGVPQDSASYAQDLLNVERIEVLRGPQGSLYGRNAMAGVINIVTSTPGDTPYGRVEIGAGDYGQWLGAGYVSGPLAEDWYGDVGLKWRKSDGDIDNLTLGLDDLGGYENLSGRARLRYAPKDRDLEINLTAFGQDDESSAYDYIFSAPAMGAGPWENRQSLSSVKPHTERRSAGLSLDVDAGLADGLNLRSITAFQDLEYNTRFDPDFSPGDSNPQYPAYDEFESQTLVSQELRLSAEPDANGVGWLAGLYAEHQDYALDRRIANASVADYQIDRLAAFGEVNWLFATDWELTGGLRVSHERHDMDLSAEGFAPWGLAPFDLNDSDSFTAVLPKLSLAHHLSDEVMVYTSAGRGYKPGGFNRTAKTTGEEVPFDPEYTWNYELGVKSQWLNDRLQLNAAVYYIDWSDVQLYYGSLPAPLANVGDATSKGIELEIVARPTERLEVYASANWGCSAFTDYRDPSGVADHSGNKLPYAPDLMTNLALQYRFDLGNWGELSPRIEWQHVGKFYFSESNSIAQERYDVVNLRANWRLNDDFSLIASVENATDEDYLVSAFDYGGGAGIYQPAAGRRFLVTARYEF